MKRTRGPDAIARHRIGALLASGLLVAGCGTPHFAREPKPPADLSGRWVLDRSASDDAAALIAASVPAPKHPPPVQPRAESWPPQGGQPPGGQRGSGSGSGSRRSGRDQSQSEARAAPADAPSSWGRLRPAEFVSAFATPPPTLEIDARPGQVSLGSAAHRRNFEPGDEQPDSITDRYGSRRVSAGWQADEFIVHSEDGSRLKVVEHYRRRGDDRLELVVDFQAAGVKSLTVRSVYRRATPAELEAASEAGPPEPHPR